VSVGGGGGAGEGRRHRLRCSGKKSSAHVAWSWDLCSDVVQDRACVTWRWDLWSGAVREHARVTNGKPHLSGWSGDELSEQP
jgi:hypothetical protein